MKTLISPLRARRLLQVLNDKGFQLKKKTATEYCCPCPFCGGVDRFCVWPEKNQYWCRQCDRKGDDIELLRELDGLSFPEAQEVTGRDGNSTKTKSKAKTPFVHPELGKPDDVYPYTDQEGKQLFHVCRFGNGEGKTFRQCKPDGLTWNLNKVSLVLYNLPEVHKVDHLAFVEGEKDCHALAGLGFSATTNPMGAGKPLEEWQEKHKIFSPLQGKTVFIFPDKDEPGAKHAEQVGRLLIPIAKTVKMIRLPLEDGQKDVSDFIEKHGDEAKRLIMEAVAMAPVWTPPRNYFTLREIMEIPPDTHLPIIDDGIMPWNSHILIAGGPKVGKSLLRLELAIYLAMGWEWMGFKIPKARTVGIIQFENSERSEQFRIKQMVKGLGLKTDALGDRIRYAKREKGNRPNLSLKGERAKLLEMVRELGCEVIIYDCLTNFHASNENDNVAMRDVLEVFVDIDTELGTSSIVIHHFGKPGDNPRESQHMIRGASSIIDWASTVITIKAKSHEHKVIREIRFPYVRDGKEPRPFYVERDQETFLCSFYDEESLVSPAIVKEVLNEEFNGAVDKQKDLMKALMSKTGCSDRTAKAGIRNAVKMKTIYEYGAENARSKGYRVPMSG